MAKLRQFIAAAFLLATATQAAGKSLDVSRLDDRVDPVPVGDEIVYEISLDVTFAVPAPGVVVTLHLPPGVTYLSARRQPDYALIGGAVSGSDVRFDLGEEPPCNKRDLPSCASIWVLAKVGNSVDPGTVMKASVDATSTNPSSFPADTHTVYTSAGSLAIRKGRTSFGAKPGRDRIQLEGDLGRTGWASPNLPPPPQIDIADGVRVKVGEAGAPPVLDVTVPGDAFRCSGAATKRCRLKDPKLWRPLGLDRLNVSIPYDMLQRNNAGVLVRTTYLTLSPDIGPDMELTVVSGGETFGDTALHVVGKRRLTYTHTQVKP